MSGPYPYKAIPHPEVAGAWTVTLYDHGFKPMFASKASAELLAERHNNALHRRGKE